MPKPLPVTVASEAKRRIPSYPKMFQNPGGDWNPGKGETSQDIRFLLMEEIQRAPVEFGSLSVYPIPGTPNNHL